MKNKLRQDNVIELQQFLKKEFVGNIEKKIKGLKFKREEKLMSHSYSYSDDEKTIQKISEEIIPFIMEVIPIKNIDISIVKMEHKDYILVHEKKHKIFILDVTTTWNDESGGNIIFTDTRGNGTIIQSKCNSLIISNGKFRFFIKYINHHAAKKAKYYIIGRFQ